MYKVRYLVSEVKNEWAPIIVGGRMEFDYAEALRLKREWEALGYRVKIG